MKILAIENHCFNISKTVTCENGNFKMFEKIFNSEIMIMFLS